MPTGTSAHQEKSALKLSMPTTRRDHKLIARSLHNNFLICKVRRLHGMISLSVIPQKLSNKWSIPSLV